MAEKLHSQYNFSYDNLKVLLGGWNTWKQENAKDPNAYPLDITEGSTPAASDSNPLQIITATVALQPEQVTTPAPNLAPDATP